MAVRPKQIKVISLENLNKLRLELRSSFKKSTGNDLPGTYNKSNVLYSDLTEDIRVETKNKISEPTILKFFYEDDNRKYQVIILQTIEKYIKKIGEAEKQDDADRPTAFTPEKMEGRPEVKAFAQRIYIELVTRKAAIPLDEDNDVIEEIYDSWYKVFCIIRDELKGLPVNCLDELKNPESPPGLAVNLLNGVLRPHLTEHQAKFRVWLLNEKTNPKNKNLTPQVLQKKYYLYDGLINSMIQTSIRLEEMANKLESFAS